MNMHEARRDPVTGRYFSKRILVLDETKFESENVDEETAYWLGFIVADGNVIPESKHGQAMFQMILQGRDQAHLEKFKIFMNSGHKIFKSIKHGREYFTIKFRSNKIVSDLIKFNVIPDKTFSTYCPEFLLYNRHFWRGMIDGDGTLGLYWSINGNGRSFTEVISLTGTIMICNQFREFCRNILHSHISEPVVSKNSFKVTMASKKAYSISKYLYEDSMIFLDRKYNKYLEIKQSRIDRSLDV